MVGCGLERGSNDTRERCVVSGLVFHRAMAVLALFPPARGDADTSDVLVYSPFHPVTTGTPCL
jgi:hypothetical protein